MSGPILCRESVSVVGEIATCVRLRGHDGKHQLIWEGDPEMYARKIAARYLEGLVALKAKLVELADEIQHAIDEVKEAP